MTFQMKLIFKKMIWHLIILMTWSVSLSIIWQHSFSTFSSRCNTANTAANGPFKTVAFFLLLNRYSWNTIIIQTWSEAREIVNAISEKNAILKHTQVGGSLSTTCRTASFTKNEFGIVEPFEFVIIEDKQTVVYIPVLKMLQALLNRPEVLHEALKCNIQGWAMFQWK